MSYTTQSGEVLRGALRDDYENLPAAIKAICTPLEYLWIGEGRAKLIEQECYPDGDYEE
jgi:hypothetical protein